MNTLESIGKLRLWKVLRDQPVEKVPVELLEESMSFLSDWLLRRIQE